MTITFKIFPAFDAYIYMPVQLAIWEQNPLLRTFLNDRRYRAILEPAGTDYGDENAIKKMANAIRNDQPAIAVCDPMALINFVESSENQGLKNLHLKVFGSLIKKPPFWIVDKCPAQDTLERLRPFTHVIYHNSNLQTGHFIGRHFLNRYEYDKRPNKKEAPLGKDLDELTNFYLDNQAHAAAITADLLGIAIAKTCAPDDAYKACYEGMDIVYSYSKHFRHFITTAFITSERILNEHEEFIVSFLSANISAMLLYEFMAGHHESVFLKLARDGKNSKDETAPSGTVAESLKAQVYLPGIKISESGLQEAAKFAHDMVMKERLYDPHLRISKSDWDAAVELTNPGGSIGALRDSFYTLVDDELVVKATKRVNDKLRKVFKASVNWRERYIGPIRETFVFFIAMIGSLGAVAYAFSYSPTGTNDVYELWEAVDKVNFFKGVLITMAVILVARSFVPWLADASTRRISENRLIACAIIILVLLGVMFALVIFDYWSHEKNYDRFYRSLGDVADTAILTSYVLFFVGLLFRNGRIYRAITRLWKNITRKD